MTTFIRLTIAGALLTAASPAFATQVLQVPEPATWLPLAAGIGALAFVRHLCGRK